MGSVKSGLCSIVLAGLVGTVAVLGCSADGSSDPISEPAGNLTPEQVVLPPPSQNEAGTSPEGGGKDAGKDAAPRAEAGIDAGPPPPVEGTPCPTINTIAKRPCGACGIAETICLTDGAGGSKWTVYGACTNEVVGGCMPGTTVQEDCGNCGKATKTCTAFCAYTSGVCTGQPMNSCAKGTVEYAGAGCDALSYRNRTCSDACTWGNFTTACAAPNNPNKLTLSATAMGTVVANYTLSTAKMGPRVSGSCPAASISATTDHPYEIVEVMNSTTQTAKVSAWLTGAPAIDTVMVAYNTNLPPQTDAERKACAWGSNDICPSSLPCSTATEWSGLTGTQQITIAPGKVVLIQFAAWYSSSDPTDLTTGPTTLTVRTDALQ